MSSRNGVNGLSMVIGRGVLVLVAALLLAACSSGGTAAPEPTQTLIPPTETPIPQVILPTATPEATLPRPGDIAVASPQAAASDAPADSISLETDPVAAELVALARRRIAQELNLPSQRVQLVEIQAVRWPDSSLGCPAAGQAYTQGEVDGYRMVLSAGDRQYYFHTDFDRALPCDAAREVLPEATEQP